VKSKTIFTHGMTGEGVVGDPSVDTRHGPKTKSFGYQVLGFGSGGVSAAFVAATGGNSTSTCGDYKTHNFTGPGTLCVSCAGNTAGNDKIDFLVVAGGAAGGGSDGAGGGAGGYRESKQPGAPWTASPIVATPGSGTNGITAAVQPYPITVGGGGAQPGGPGNDSVFDSITSAKGGGGPVPSPGAGGSGAGGYPPGGAGSAGNTPPTTPSQGNPGGSGSPGSPTYTPGGGGGAGGVGGDSPTTAGGTGGVGVTTSISETPLAYAGGGGGGRDSLRGASAPAGSPCGTGGAGGCGGAGTAGTTNRGGAGGGGQNLPPTSGGAGGSGIVIIRYKYQ